MSNWFGRAALSTYKWAGFALFPGLVVYLAMRTAKGKEDAARRRERFGRPTQERPSGPLVWFHAASVGETTAVLPLMREIRNRGIQVILTTGTVTSAAVARDRAPDGVIHQYVPLDIKPAVSRFLDYWKPDAAIIAESEIWPVTVMELGARHIPQILVNGRLSDKSFALWKRLSSLSEELFRNFALVIAQSEEDGIRYTALGALPVLVSGNLKGDNDEPPYNPEDLEHYRQQIAGRHTWAAISTFEGEEEMAGRIHQRLKRKNNQLTVIVPRHPERADEIQKKLEAMGLDVARRSHGDAVTRSTDILLGDTIGEMGLYLNLTDIVFVGRSMHAEGGQNPLEPAMIGCAVLSGGKVQNFRDAYQRLAKNGGAKIVRDEDMLAKGVHYLMNNDEVRHKMINAGLDTVQQMRGALEATLKGLAPYINPLVVKSYLDNKE
ncbi:lipid IV(A) 3-deoxy-D-manno-octulosonic acid transferase [Rhizobium sp. L1K21]|uniref:lipid IV(A) 3-deoxy-D-manno-octulosonic acid transferase n=1 Tax=Rhizobium sp. L1K21 TaxID=2954933 RepID=UPI00209360B0|nr:lipid IV(A) 3-deoxy-D-manno-octulosonic acid transferase [Rhizobium sp. L1K21]MCO6186964.1 lipid IV(A) 3-deoxy-D-manno-octulosonic acid transferase [Rhizobium sp. L1K21]